MNNNIKPQDLSFYKIKNKNIYPLYSDEYFMFECLKYSLAALKSGDIPVAAIIVQNNKIISKAYNQREMKQIASGHAEILALNKANIKLKSWRLNDCDIYVSLEPCIMCAGAIIHNRCRRLIYAAPDPKAGAVNSQLQLLSSSFINHQCQVKSSVLENDASNLLKEYFKLLRDRKKY